MEKAPPIRVKYLVGDDAIKEFINVLQNTIFNLERDISKIKKQQKPREQGKSPRTVRRVKDAAMRQIADVTGQKHCLVEKQSPRKTTVRLDDSRISVRKYRRLKGPHQPTLRNIAKARDALNKRATDVASLLKSLVAKCRCEGPARVKVSMDGHNPTKNSVP